MDGPKWTGRANALFQSRENGCNCKRANKHRAKTRQDRTTWCPSADKWLRVFLSCGLSGAGFGGPAARAQWAVDGTGTGGSLNSQLLLMRLHQFMHAVECEV